MKLRRSSAALLAAMLAAPAAAAAGGFPRRQARPNDGRQVAARLTAAEIHALVARTLANQHRNDQANYEYEHVERRMRFSETGATEDKTYRVVPTGTGTLSLLVKEGQHPVELDAYLKQLRSWEHVLTIALTPNDPSEQESEEKRRKRDRKRAELVGAVTEAFRFTWLGRESLKGRAVVKLRLEPNPGYRPASSATDMLTHVEAIVWIDEQAAQVVAAQAMIIRDIAIGGGIVGKIYKGGWLQLTQQQVTGEVWEPARIEYAVAERKFLFPSVDHARTEYRRYEQVGTPRDALALVRSELKSGQAFAGDP
jgi:hypothetical protein